MKIIKSFFISFSLFSKIPVPSFNWKEEDMQYSFVFFPWIGAVIGGLLLLWRFICDLAGIGDIPWVLIGCGIPIIVTGGFHVDGFMDTMDAFKSFKGRQDKLEILKDPHIGAFSVIMLALFGLVYVSAFSQIDKSVVPVFASCFFLARTLSGLAAVTVKNARGEGILFTFSESAGYAPVIVKILLAIQFLACSALMMILMPCLGALCVAAALITFAYYIYKSKKELGGITGDTEGYFVCICEAVIGIVCAVYSLAIF